MPSSLIGVAIACSGNVIISLALTIQKLAHRRQEQEHSASRGQSPAASRADSDDSVNTASEAVDEAGSRDGAAGAGGVGGVGGQRGEDAVGPIVNLGSDGDGTVGSGHDVSNGRSERGESYHGRSHCGDAGEDGIYTENRQTYKTDGENGSSHVPDGDQDQNQGDDGVEEGRYLKSKLWWLGQALITLGEGGNFLSYAFAPASVVAPLGTVALIANCVFAPLILGERFMPREFIGMGLAIVGAVTVVYASNGDNPRLNPHQLLTALLQLPFLIYTLLSTLLALLLALLSRSPAYGGKYIGIDVGVCCLFGGYTVLSTKALASLLSTRFLAAFRYPIAWVLVLVLVGTSVMQVKYLNRALMRFQSKEVIPTQFVFFSLAAIIGSAVLYQEFRDTPFNQFVNFAFGIATTFLGVYLLTSPSDTSNAHHGSNDEDEVDPDRHNHPGGHDQRNTTRRPIRPIHAHTRGPSRTLTVHLPSVHERSPLLIPVNPHRDIHTQLHPNSSSTTPEAGRQRSLRSAPVAHVHTDAAASARLNNTTGRVGSYGTYGMHSASLGPRDAAPHGSAYSHGQGHDALSPITSPNPRYLGTSPSPHAPGVSVPIISTSTSALPGRLLKRASTGSFRGMIGSQAGVLLLATPPGSVQRGLGVIGPEAYGQIGQRQGAVGGGGGGGGASLPGSRRGSRARGSLGAEQGYEREEEEAVRGEVEREGV